MGQHTTTRLEPTNPRNKIIDIYLEPINKSLIDTYPIIKLVNFGTGSGKTHQYFQAVLQIIQDNPGVQIIGLYVAPLRENLTVPPSILSENPGIPFYILFSEEWKTSDEFLKKYNRWIPAIRANQKLWGQLTKSAGQSRVGEAVAVLSKAKAAISVYELIRQLSDSDNDALKAKLLQAQRDITGSLDKFLDILIRAIPDEDAWPDECLELVKIYYPLFLLRERSGVLLMTYKKFETEIPYFVEVDKRWIQRKSRFDKYVREYSSETCRFLMAFDEQEDGYQIMLEEQIDIISPKALGINNALSSIYREFAVLFSGNSEENRAFLRFLRKNPGALREWIEYYEKGKEIDNPLKSLAGTFHRLTYLDGNSPNFLTQIAAIDAGIEASFQSINSAFGNFGEEQQVWINFERLAKVLAEFENNRALVIPHKLYSRYAEDLMNIFSYNNLYIYNIEVLKDLAIQRKSSGHVLIYEIDENKQNEVTVAELIYAILAVRLQIDAVRKLLGAALDADDSQSRSLDIWSKQITRLQKFDESSQPPASILLYLDRVYVYERLKSIINIMEISRYQNPENNLIHSPLREVSIGSTAILTSPEHRILSLLKDTHNVIFLVSATGGVYGDLSTSFDMRYLEDELRNDETGLSSFEPMRDGELFLSEQIRAYRRQNRNISVGFFNEDFSSFPNQQTRAVVERFEKSILSTFLDEQTEGRWFGAYKLQEIRNFIRFLFYLFEDDSVHQIIAFTQTLTFIRKLINHAVRVNNLQFIFLATNEHPNIFTVEVHHAKYASQVRIRLILYESKFNTQYKSGGRIYQDELVQRDGEKIFFISAYQSASKGLNPTIRVSEGSDQEKDFDAIVLLMDKYFSVMGPGTGKSKDSGQSTTQAHFALMKNLVSLGNNTIEIKDFNRYLSDPEAKQFRDLQHHILLGKGILQSIGRTERRDYPGQTIRIFINDESRKNLVHFYGHLQRREPDEIRKLSVNNYEVFERVMEEERKHIIQDYDSHVLAEIDATVSFQSFRKIMLDQIVQLHENAGTAEIVKQWEMLRDPLVFQNPAAYLEMLRRSTLFPTDFVDSLFYQRGAEQPEFIPYLASEEDEGRTHLILSDSQHSDKEFPYLSRMHPDFLKIGAKGFDADGEEIASSGDPSTDQIQAIYRKFIPNPAVFAEYIPRPRFFYDVLYPSLTENIVETWIREVIFEGKNWKSIQTTYEIKPLTDFRTYHKLFERFDLFYVRGSELYCIDVKAWSEVSGYRLSQKTVDKAIRKLVEIQAAHPEFSRVSGLLLNMHAPLEKQQKLAADLTSGNLFYLDANHNPVESTTLRDFLIRRGR